MHFEITRPTGPHSHQVACTRKDDLRTRRNVFTHMAKLDNCRAVATGQVADVPGGTDCCTRKDENVTAGAQQYSYPEGRPPCTRKDD